MPLWGAYLVKVYAWRTILQEGGFLEWVLTPLGIAGPGLDEITNSWLVFSYLWLPYKILPLFAGLDRIPVATLEAARDLGASRWQTFRRVTWPLSRPAVVVSLLVTALPMLGDYFTNDLLSGSPTTSMVGNLINNSVLTPGQTGQAGAFVMLILLVSVVPMLLYVRSTRTGVDVQS